MPRMLGSCSQSLLSTVKFCGPTMACCEFVVEEFRRQLDHLRISGSSRSNLAAPAWNIRPSQRLPCGSVSRSSAPVGQPWRCTGTANALCLSVLVSSRPSIWPLKSLCQTMPSASTITSCGWMVCSGRSYSVMMTLVPAPLDARQGLELPGALALAAVDAGEIGRDLVRVRNEAVDVARRRRGSAASCRSCCWNIGAMRLMTS